MVSLDGKLAQCLGTCGRLLSLGIQVPYVPLDPRQLGVTTEFMAPLGDEAVGGKARVESEVWQK